MFRIILVMLFGAIVITAQEKELIIAKAGDKIINTDEFKARFHLNPQLGIHRKSQAEGSKKIFLYGLIAEKLLSLDAEDKGLDTSATVRFFLKNFEKLFIRDELYNKEIKQKSKDYAENILSFYLENSSRVFTKNIISRNEKEINRIYSLLNKGVPFDSVYTELTPEEKDTITLYSGTLDIETEKEIFDLPEKNFTRPLQYNNYWVIFYIEKKNDPVIAKSLGWETEYKRLEKAAAEKAEAVFYKEFMKKFFPGKKAEAKGYFVKSLAEKLSSILSERGDTVASASDFIKISRMYSSDTLNADFIVMEKGNIPFIDFINWMRIENFQLKDLTYEKTAALLNSKVKKYIEFELLAREGYRQGLDKSENVKSNYAMWRDNYLYQLGMSAMTDSLFSGNQEYSYFKIIEIVNSDLSVIEKSFNELSEGKDFFQTALKYSSDIPDTNFRHISSFDDIKDELIMAEIGELYGPVDSEKGYIIFKILDRQKTTGPSGNYTITGTKDNVNQYIAELANKYNLTINEDLLSEIPVSNINAMVFKYIGFGGRISAVPIINPVSEWFPLWQKEIKINP